MGSVSKSSKVSFIEARDPRAICNRLKTRTNLEQIIEAEDGSTVLEEDNNIQVYLRVKSGIIFENLYEISENTLLCHLPEGSHAMRNAKEGDRVTKKYAFSQIFGPEASQSNIFNCVLKPKLLSFMNGTNNTILTYGASGSGKTFTIVGSKYRPGLIPRALEYLFRSIPELSQNPTVKPLPNGQVILLSKTEQKNEKLLRNSLLYSSMNGSLRSIHSKIYRKMQESLRHEPSANIVNSSQQLSVAVWVSFAEIYNECIYDLLVADSPKGKNRTKLKIASSGFETYIRNLTNISVTSGEEAYQILQYGLHNLNIASTSINSQSSRSHSILTIKLVQTKTTNYCVQINHFNFCDLAGADRLSKTNNICERLVESNNINTSLLVLGKCISIVRDAQRNGTSKIVPFRESKLTQLFQKALQGNENIFMIVTINPAFDVFHVSQHVLNFSAIAKDILIEERKPATWAMKTNFFSPYMRSTNKVKKNATSKELQECRNIIKLFSSNEEMSAKEISIDELLSTNEEISTREISIDEIVSTNKELSTKVNLEFYEKLMGKNDLKIGSSKQSFSFINPNNNKRDKAVMCELSSIEVVDIEDLKEELQSVQERMDVYKNMHNNLMIQLQDKEKEYKHAKYEMVCLKNQKTELQSTLEYAKEIYLDLQSTLERTLIENSKLKSEIFALKEREYELEQTLLVNQRNVQIRRIKKNRSTICDTLGNDNK